MKRIAFVQYTSPAAYPPIMNAARICRDSGLRVSLWGVQSQGAAGSLQMDACQGMDLSLMPYCAPGVWQKFHYLRFFIVGVLRCLWFRPSVVYCSDLWSYPIGWVLSQVLGFRVVAHEHDSPASDGSFAIRVCLSCREMLFRRSLVVFPQRERSEIAAKSLMIPSKVVVWNCPRMDEVVDAIPVESRESITLWYHGSIVPSQFPSTIIQAMAILPGNYRLRFAGYETIGSRGYIASLMDLARTLGIADRVEYVGAIPTRSGLFTHASQCDVGLALFDRQFREPMVGASNKPFDYLACGLAVLANGSSEWVEFFKEIPAVFHADPADPDAIAAALKCLVGEASTMLSVRHEGIQKIRDDWNYETQFQPVLEAIRC